MKHEIITTENYLLVVDDSEIKEKSDDWFYSFETNKIYDAKTFYPTINCKRIIAHLPLNPPFIYGYTNSPILVGVDLLPPLREEVEKLADEIVGDSIYYEEYRVNLSDGMDLFMFGYNKAKEKYKYTEEDLRKAWNAAYVDALSIDEETYKPLFFENFIQSLQQPKMPVAFEHENTIRPDTGDLRKEVPAQWVGRYIYE